MGACMMLKHCRKERGNNNPIFNKIDKILIIVGMTAVLFICTMIYLFTKYQSVPDSLIAGFFAAVFGEVSICGWVKSSVEKSKNREETEL